MSSGVTLEEDLVDRFNRDFKMVSTSKYNYMIFCFTPDKKKIRIEQQGTDDKELVEFLKGLRDSGKGCYFVYHQKQTNSDGTSKGTKLKLVLYSDDDHTGVGDRLLVASSFDAIKKRLDGVQIERQLHGFDDVLEDLELQHCA